MGTILSGTGRLKAGPQRLGTIAYQIETSSENGLATIVKFGRRPPVRSGRRLHLTLEDGRMLDCLTLDKYSYCAVVGEGPYADRRRAPRPRSR